MSIFSERGSPSSVPRVQEMQNVPLASQLQFACFEFTLGYKHVT